MPDLQSATQALESAILAFAKCRDEARRLIPLLIADNYQMREVLEGLHDELVGSGRLVSNPKLIARAIGAVIKERLAE